MAELNSTDINIDYVRTFIAEEEPQGDANTLDANVIIQKIYLAIGILGMADNSFVALVLITARDLRGTTTNIFIINQSLIDFSVSVFIVATNFLRDVTLVPPGIGREIFCRFWLTNMPIWGLFISSTYNLVSMTLERYYALVHPLKHSMNFSKKKAAVMIAFAWIIGPVFYTSYTATTSFMPNSETCSVINKWPSYGWQRAAGICITTFQYFIPLAIIIYCYTCIILVLRRSSKSENPDEASSNRGSRMGKAKKNVIKTLLLVSLCFVFCWSWNQFYYLLFNLGQELSFNTPFYHFTVIAVFVNCSLNPIVYAVKYEQFQKRVVMIFCSRYKTTHNSAPSVSDISFTPGTDLSNKDTATIQEDSASNYV